MATLEEDLSNTRALIIDSNPSMRAVLAAQMREFGVKTVVQCGRVIDARRNLEYQKFDFVLCEHYFNNEDTSGQDLLDDLRRNQLLPFATVFVMITGEATYAKVAEAAESALDGYLLKPHKPSKLYERLIQARLRKNALEGIFIAIESSEFETAIELCKSRFESKAPFWLYSARIGAEILLRMNKPAEAKKLYEAIIEAKTLPWARLGVARSMLDGGQTSSAMSMLEQLITADPTYTDAYDVMGRAQFELGKFDEALKTYQLASNLTPASISRIQSVGIMAFYAGNLILAEEALRRTCSLGLDSKLFDYQSLVLLAFVHFTNGDHKALHRCEIDFIRISDNSHCTDPARVKRLASIVHSLNQIQNHKIAQALECVRKISEGIQLPEFNFESATNLVGLFAQLASRAIQLEEAVTTIEHIAMRFCSNQSMCDVLVCVAKSFPQYESLIRASNRKILDYTKHAMTLSLNGDPNAAVTALIARGEETLNLKFLENAEMVLSRYRDILGPATDLHEKLSKLREQCSNSAPHNQINKVQRQGGSIKLRR